MAAVSFGANGAVSLTANAGVTVGALTAGNLTLSGAMTGVGASYAATVTANNLVTSGGMSFNNQVNNQVISMYTGDASLMANSTNFYGFGVNSYTLRYQAVAGASHTWYCNTTPVMNLTPSMLSIPGPIVQGTSTDNSRAISCLNSALATNGGGIGITLGQTATANNQAELSFNYYGNGSATNRFNIGFYGSYSMSCLPYGVVGVNTTSPLFNLHTQTNLTDVPATNPDATNSVMVYEDCRGSNVSYGTLSGTAVFVANSYIQLTSPVNNQTGCINYLLNPGTAFDVTADTYINTNGSGTYADAISFYCFAGTANPTYGGSSTGYQLTFDDYAQCTSSYPYVIALYWNGTLLQSQTSSAVFMPINTWNQVRISFVRNTWKVWFNNQLVINYQDVNRVLIGSATYNMGFNGFTGGQSAGHYVRNIQISKHAQGPWRPTLMGNVTGISYSGNVGVGTTAPADQMHLYNTSNTSYGVYTRYQGNTSSYFQVGQESGGVSNFHIYNQAGTGVYLQNGSTSWSSNSDRRLKTNVANIADATSLLARLRPVTYNWRTEEAGAQLHPGLIAQEVRELIPELVTRGGNTDRCPDGALGVAYGELVPYLVQCVRELDARCKRLEAATSQPD